MDASIAPWFALIISVLMLVGVWILVPKVKTIVSERMAEFDAKFTSLENSAHKEILDAITRMQDTFSGHNADPYAHPNHMVSISTEGKLEEVRVELVRLQVIIEGWQAFFTATPPTTANIKPYKRGKK